MKILILHRTKEDATGKSVEVLRKSLEKKGHKVDAISRKEDLNLTSLSGSMDGIRELVERKDSDENYDIIYTQDWSIAFPLLFPTKILFEKHYCLFHGVEEVGGAQSKILQKITGNLLGNHLLVKTQELKERFPKAALAAEGLEILSLAK